MRRRVSGVLLLSAILFGCSTHQPPQQIGLEPKPACVMVGDSARQINVTSSGPAVSDSVAPGELAGTVVDAETGKPLWAQITFPARPMSGVLADSTGRFRVPMPPDATTALVRSIGYARATFDIPIHGNSGLVVLVALRREPVCIEYTHS